MTDNGRGMKSRGVRERCQQTTGYEPKLLDVSMNVETSVVPEMHSCPLFFTVSVFEMVPLLDFGGFLSFWARLEVVVSLENNPSSSDVLRRLDRRFGAVTVFPQNFPPFSLPLFPGLFSKGMELGRVER